MIRRRVPLRRVKMTAALLAFFTVSSQRAAFAQERTASPYFIAYDHYLEEAGALEVGNVSTPGQAHGINTFLGNWTDFEYGVTKWWTTELYLDWQHTQHDSSVFTGVRFENRVRPWSAPHRINPVLYVEYEHLNGADKTIKEVVGFDSKDSLGIANSDARLAHEREIETKLILSSDAGAWNLSENLIAVRNVHEGPWEFGYAVGVSRRLAAANGQRCTLCAERFAAGVEVYGGLGEWGNVTLSGTSHYIAPVLMWALPTETTIRVSPGWGVTDQSLGFLLRIGVSVEIDGLGQHLKSLLGRH